MYFLPNTKDEQQPERKGERMGEEEEGEEGAQQSVMCTDVAPTPGQTLPVFCVHLHLVSPLLH